MPTIVVDGEVVGTWKRTLTAKEAIVTHVAFESLSAKHARGFAVASAAYGQFIGRTARIT
jgi:hypothetical protein